MWLGGCTLVLTLLLPPPAPCLCIRVATQRLTMPPRPMSAQCLQASRDYNLGEGPELSATTVAAARGWAVPANYGAEKFDDRKDVILFDLILTMDKYTTADVLREISVGG
jgi:hypothetical protein